MYLRHTLSALFWTLPLVLVLGCSSSETPQTAPEKVTVDLGSGNSLPVEDDLPNETKTSKEKPTRRFQPIALGTNTTSAASGSKATNEQKFDSVLEALKPLQIMLGNWGGITSKKIGGFSSVETLDWVWDLQTDPAQPSLVMKADKSRYYKNARLTYLTDKQKYQLTLTNKEDQKRIYEGDFSVPLKMVPGDADPNIMHATYKLTLNLVEPAGEKKRAQIVLNQQNNDRYLFELNDLRRSGPLRFDTISTRRKGSSFAKSDSDYGSKTCVISGGLGTSQVTYQGKSFWVCCSGCRKAFDADPEKWIAKYEANKKKNMKQ